MRPRTYWVHTDAQIPMIVKIEENAQTVGAQEGENAIAE